MDLDIDIENWPAGDWDELAQRVATAAIGVAPELKNARLSASVLFTNNEQVHTLNREWRDKDKATNVLSFPMMDRSDLLELDAEGPPAMIGDIALAFETCALEAEAKSISLEDHAAHLILHGLLHLAGHDHVTSEEDADKMEGLEITALAKLGIADPYGDRDL